MSQILLLLPLILLLPSAYSYFPYRARTPDIYSQVDNWFNKVLSVYSDSPYFSPTARFFERSFVFEDCYYRKRNAQYVHDTYLAEWKNFERSQLKSVEPDAKDGRFFNVTVTTNNGVVLNFVIRMQILWGPGQGFRNQQQPNPDFMFVTGKNAKCSLR